jgi:chromosome segregation protein
MHVIVGQGQLDSVLSASPEDRRGFIEEAAGVLKHRKRKEKALRKLDAMQTNLVRLQDLTAELRRQLKPLGKQAEVARRAAVVQADLRDARLRLLADDLVQMRTTLEAEVADEALILERRGLVERELTEAQARETELEQVVASLTPRLARAQETWYRLSSLRERFRGTAELAAERTRHLAEGPQEERRGRDPEDMEREAREIRAQEAELAEALAEAQELLAEAVQQRADSETALAVEEKRLVTVQRAAADRREGLARLTGQVNAARSRMTSAEAELGRLREAREAARARAEQAEQEYAELREELGDDVGAAAEGGTTALDRDHEEATAALVAAEDRLGELRAAERDAERERAALAARTEALQLGLAHKDGSGALLAASDRVSGVIGAVAALITVEPGAETAVAAALGAAADAVAVDGVDSAVAALRLLRADDAGQAALLVGGATGTDEPWPALPGGARYAADLVTISAELRPALRRLLHQVAVVGDLAAARELVAAVPGVRAVTRDGDLLGSAFASGGSSDAPSLIEVQAAVDEARSRLTEAEARCLRLRAELDAAGEAGARAKQRLEEITRARRESEKRASAVAQQLGRLGGQARAAAGEVERLDRSARTAEESLDQHRAQLAELEERLDAAQDAAGDAPGEDEPSTAERDRLATACAEGRQAEMEARLAVRTGEERVRALAGRADGLDRAAQQERTARARAIARRERMARQAAVATAVARGAALAMAYLDISLARAAREREAADRVRTAREAEMKALRGRTRELSAELDQLTDAVHKDEVARTEQRMLIQRLEQQALEEFGVDAEALIAEYGPHLPVPPSPPAQGEVRSEDPAHPDNQPRPYVRAEQEKRLKAATRGLTLLGKVNPLALEEFAALEERHKFLTEQLEDLKATRRDLLTVIRDVDERVEQVFTAAYHDTEREFEKVFARLFPGGEGRLVLTDPSDMLTTGIEVEARPPGKKVKRLSLLSGGERSLTAVALLVAIFKARPSPFYVMDEVEAALDDTNLQRLLVIMEELRESSQLIVITHQKRTMEIADALYGVAMRGDGVTTVISQRMREPEPA